MQTCVFSSRILSAVRVARSRTTLSPASAKYGAVLDLRPPPCSLFLVSAMSLPAEHLCCSSYASSDTEGGGTRQLTAAQELHGHVEDCLSLYSSRFVHAPTSLAAIQRVAPSPPNNASCTDGEAVEEDDGEGGVDASTVATVVWLRDGVRAATPNVPLGVLLTFQYWKGFRVCAERTYVSLADAETAAASVANASQWSPEDLMRADGGWKRIADEGGDEAADGGGDPEAHSPSYESLMALLVHRYL